MKKQIVITVNGGIVQHIETNFDDVDIKIVDYDQPVHEQINIVQPDTINLNENIIDVPLN